jgi:tetratricopeptide (TPR) repeat protein
MDIEEVSHALLSIAYSREEEKARKFLEKHKNSFDEKAVKEFSEIAWFLVESGDFTAAENLADATYSIFHDHYMRGRILIFKGNIEFRKENYKKAADLFKESQKILENHVDSTVAEMDYGLALQRLGNTEEASIIFKKTYFIFKKENCTVAAASAIQNLGDLYQEQSVHKKALSCYKKAKRIYETESNSVDIARVEVSMGVSLHNLYKFPEALNAFDHALSVFEREEFFVDVARVHLNKSTLLITLKRLDEAEESLTIAEELFMKAELYSSAASVLLNKAMVYRLKRMFNHALDAADRAVRTFASCGLYVDSAKALREKAEIAVEMGKIEDAEDFLATCSLILSSEREKALTNIVRATLLRVQGEYTKAMALSEELLHYFYEQTLERATILMNYSILLYELNEYKQSLHFLDEAKTIYESYGIVLKVCDVEMNRAILLFETSHLEESLHVYQNTKKIFTEMKMEVEAARVDVNIGNVLKEQGDIPGCLQKFFSAHALFTQYTLGRELYMTKVNIGFALLHTDDTEESEKYLNPALEYAAMSKDFQLEYVSLYGLGLIEASKKNFEGALQLFEKSVSSFYKVRSLIASEPLRISYLKNKRGIYNQLISVCFETDTYDTLVHYIELFKSRTIYEKITGVQEGVSVKEVKDYLLADEVLLNYYVIPDKILIGVFSREGFQVQVSPYQEDLYKMLLELKVRLFFRSRRLDILQRFYKLLISPVEDLIQGKKVWCAPHDLLHYVPFASLFDGDHFLVENHTVAVIPSASLLVSVGPWDHSSHTALLVRGSDLTFAEKEIEGIENFFKDKKVLVGNTGLDCISRYLPRDVVHFACHGSIKQDDPLFSWLKLSESHTLRAADVLTMDFTGSLVVLSACNTGVNKILAGDEPMGFLRTFLYAGAKSIVSSLYVVDDKSTSQLFVEFYRNLKQGASPAEALQEAQVSFIEKGIHPYYWSSFIVVGGLR